MSCLFCELRGTHIYHDCEIINQYVKNIGEKETRRRLIITKESNGMNSESICSKSVKGYPFCNCMVCVCHIQQLHGFDKKTIYDYKGRSVIISHFAGFSKNSYNVFIRDVNGYDSEWLTCNDMLKWLKSQKREMMEIPCRSRNDYYNLSY